MATKKKLKQLEVQPTYATFNRCCAMAMETRIMLSTLGNSLSGVERLAASMVLVKLNELHEYIIKAGELLEKEYGAKPTAPQDEPLYLGNSDFSPVVSE